MNHHILNTNSTKTNKTMSHGGSRGLHFWRDLALPLFRMNLYALELAASRSQSMSHSAPLSRSDDARHYKGAAGSTQPFMFIGKNDSHFHWILLIKNSPCTKRTPTKPTDRCVYYT